MLSVTYIFLQRLYPPKKKKLPIRKYKLLIGACQLVGRQAHFSEVTALISHRCPGAQRRGSLQSDLNLTVKTQPEPVQSANSNPRWLLPATPLTANSRQYQVSLQLWQIIHSEFIVFQVYQSGRRNMRATLQWTAVFFCPLVCKDDGCEGSQKGEIC